MPKKKEFEETPIQASTEDLAKPIIMEETKAKQQLLIKENFVLWYNSLKAGETYTLQQVAELFKTSVERVNEIILQVKGKPLAFDLNHIKTS